MDYKPNTKDGYILIKKYKLPKAYVLLFIQKIVHFWWKYFDKKTVNVWLAYNKCETKKRSCPIIYIKNEKGKEPKFIPIELYFSFGGFPVVKTIF